VVYTLAGLADPSRGWGLRGDTFRGLEALARLGAPTWFQLGDADLATHIYRTERLRAGAALSRVTREIAAALGVRSAVVPVCETPLRTVVATAAGALPFQTYFVKRRARDRVTGLRFTGARQARPAPGVLAAIRRAAAVLVCPSNPFISIGPILAVPGVRVALRETRAPVVAVSPIVGGRALKGPAAAMMKSLGVPLSPAGIAGLYRDFLDVLVMDRVDARHAAAVEAMGIATVVTETVMNGATRRKALARAALAAAGVA
jgi:LPPG:FO 2-phospho-L-lactate transferase